jgi:hypothetical protein
MDLIEAGRSAVPRDLGVAVRGLLAQLGQQVRQVTSWVGAWQLWPWFAVLSMTAVAGEALRRRLVRSRRRQTSGPDEGPIDPIGLGAEVEHDA